MALQRKIPRAVERCRVFASIAATLALGTGFIAATGSAAWCQSAATDTAKIVIGTGTVGPTSTIIPAALEQGFFRKAGLDVSLQLISGGTNSVMASFASGSVNIMMVSAPELIQYTGKKVIAGKAIGEINDHQYDLVGARSLTGIADLKGKTIGISAANSGDQIFILALMKHYGVPQNDVTFLTSGSPVNRLAALAAGAIQVTAEPNGQREDSLKSGKILLKSGDSPVQFPTTMFIASNDLINNHKEILKRFFAALHEATEWVRTNRSEAVAVCTKATGATADGCASSIALSFDKSVTSPFSWSSTFAVNVEGVTSALAIMATFDPETKGLTVNDVVDTSITGTTP